MIILDIVDRAFDLTHFDVVLDLSIPDELNDFMLYFALVIILIFFFQNNITVEYILAFVCHHAHFADEVVGHILGLVSQRFVDQFAVVGLLLH